jgi:ABC-2 type transport system ATP-binding protein
MLKVESLIKQFRGVEVLRGLTFSVGAGEVLGFLGPNGAGKTTTVRIVAGAILATSGKVEINGVPIDDDPVACKRITSLVPEQPYLWERLSGYEYLSFVGKIYGLAPALTAERGNKLLADFMLLESADAMIETYSYGMRQKLVWCAALLTEPKLLLLDEPFTGLDPMSVRAARAHVEAASRRGAAVFISTHILEIAEKLCNKICILNRGKIVAAESRENLKKIFDGDMSLEDIFFEIVKDKQPGL